MNSLRVEPHSVQMEEEELDRVRTLWKVWIDGDVFTDNAEPFEASATKLVLEQCGYCGHCGTPAVAVRRLGDVILWIAAPEYFGFVFQENEYRSFSVSDYEAALSGKSSDLPELSPAEVVRIFQRQTIPTWTNAIYRLPGCSTDPHGQVLLQAINRAERDNFAGLTAHASAESIATIRIGLEEPAAAETVLELGRVATGRTVIRFHQNPALPFWIASDGLSGELDRYLAAHRSGPTAD